jgi:hypothetical protein
MLKACNTRAALFVLLIMCVASRSLPAQNRLTKEKAELAKDEQRRKLTQDIAENVLHDTRSVLNAVVRTKIRTLAAESYWHFRPQTARQILRDEFSGLKSLDSVEVKSEFWTEKDGKSNYKGRPAEHVKTQLRRELLATAGSYDAAFFRELVASEKKSETSSTEQPDQQLVTASDLALDDPQASARLIHDSLDKSIDDFFPFALTRLRDGSPAAASALFNKALVQIKASGDLWQFQRLVPYVLPDEMDRLVGGKHYLTNPERMQDARRMVEYASEILYRRIQTEAPANMPPELAKREYYLWRNLQAVVEDVNPNSLWLVNTRLRQLASVLPPSVQRPVQGPWSDDRLKTLLAAAEQSTGENRDNYLTAAAFTTWRFGEGDLDKAIALIDRIGDPKVRDDSAGIIYLQAGTKYLRSEGPDYVLDLARKINLPAPRVRLFVAVIGSLENVKATERIDSVRRELLNWLRNCERNSDTAWAILDYLDASSSDLSENKFAAFELLVRVLNSPGLQTNAGLKNRVYWYPEFHDFRKSLAPLIKADFDRTLELVQMLNSREISMQIQAAFSAVYLKSQNKKTRSLKPAI